jgi:hypothetical protein
MGFTPGENAPRGKFALVFPLEDIPFFLISSFPVSQIPSISASLSLS